MIAMLSGCPIHHPTVILKKEVFTKHNIWYDEHYPHAEDYKLWLEIGKVGKLANIPKSCVFYRIHETQTSFIHSKSQNNSAKKIRTEAINHFLSQLDIHYHIPETRYYTNIVQFNSILQQRWKFISPKNQTVLLKLLYQCYLSIHDYNFKNLWHFIRNKDKSLLEKKQIHKIIKKFIRPYKYQHL